MRYVLQVVLSNAQHPEYGQATIPFPIPNQNYKSFTDRQIDVMPINRSWRRPSSAVTIGDKITLTTKLGTRTYKVTDVSKVSETDRSGLADSGENMLTLYTCVRNQRDQRWCVTAVEA